MPIRPLTNQENEMFLQSESAHGTSMISDRHPKAENIGKRVYFVSESARVYGIITAITGRNVSIKLESRWNYRTKIIMNWMHLRISIDQSEKKPRIANEHNEERIQQLRSYVQKATGRIEITAETAAKLAVAVHAYQEMHESLVQQLRQLENIKAQIRENAEKTQAKHQECLMLGASTHALIPMMDFEGEYGLAKKGKRQKNMEQKRKLHMIREETRKMLAALLIAAGDQGATSTEVIASICSMSPLFEGNMVVTQHRVMGMLSAFSRRQEAELTNSNRWKATDALRQSSNFPPAMA